MIDIMGITEPVVKCLCGGSMGKLIAPVGVDSYLCKTCGKSYLGDMSGVDYAMQALAAKASHDRKSIFAVLEPMGIRIHTCTDMIEEGE